MTGHNPTPSLRLYLLVNASDTVAVSPDRLDFGRFARGQAVSRTAKVLIASGSSLKGASTTLQAVEAQIGPPDDQGNVPVTLTVGPDVPFGPMSGELRLQIHGQEGYMLTVPFSGFVAEKP